MFSSVALIHLTIRSLIRNFHIGKQKINTTRYYIEIHATKLASLSHCRIVLELLAGLWDWERLPTAPRMQIHRR